MSRRWLSKDKDPRVTITMADDQLYKLKEAMSLYVHCSIGNFEELKSLIRATIYRLSKNKANTGDELDVILAPLRALMFPKLVGKEPHSIWDKEVDEDARTVWDILQVVMEHDYRHQTIRVSQQYPLPKIRTHEVAWGPVLETVLMDLEKIAGGLSYDGVKVPALVQTAAAEAAEVLTKCLKRKPITKISG
jgi:hypothetical protein